MNKNNKIGLVVGGIIILIAVFYCGVVYGKSQVPIRAQNLQTFGGNMLGGRGARNMGDQGGFTTGEIISKDNKSITVKLLNGGSKIIFYTDKIAVTKMVDGTPADLSVGKQVSVTGTANPDGSLTASSAQIRPQTRTVVN